MDVLGKTVFPALQLSISLIDWLMRTMPATSWSIPPIKHCNQSISHEENNLKNSQNEVQIRNYTINLWKKYYKSIKEGDEGVMSLIDRLNPR